MRSIASRWPAPQARPARRSSVAAVPPQGRAAPAQQAEADRDEADSEDQPRNQHQQIASSHRASLSPVPNGTPIGYAKRSSAERTAREAAVRTV